MGQREVDDLDDISFSVIWLYLDQFIAKVLPNPFSIYV